MKKNQPALIFLYILGGLIGITAGIFLFLTISDVGDPTLLTPQIGVNGPIRIEFPGEVDRETITTSIHFDPDFVGSMDWDGQTLVIWPDQPLDSGGEITVTLDSTGSSGISGFFQDLPKTWTVAVREPQIAYLAAPTTSPEIWLTSIEGEMQPVTSTGGRVVGFDVSTSGEMIAYAVLNDQAGSDIWIWTRNDNASHLAYRCEEVVCIDPVFSPLGNDIVFIHQVHGEDPALWSIDLSSQNVEPVLGAAQIAAVQPEWSPDGRYVSFYNLTDNVIQIVEMTTRATFTIPSNQEESGNWLPDSQHLAFSEQLINGGTPYTQVYLADLSTGLVEPILGENPQTLEYSVPEWSPDGVWLVTSLRAMLQYGNNQLWIMHQDGSEAQTITEDALFYYGSYHWSPDGMAIVYQRFDTTRSDNVPQVMVWDRIGGESQLVVSDAALPVWIP